MASVTLPRRVHNLNLIRTHGNNQTDNTDDEETSDKKSHRFPKLTRTLSCNQSEVQSTTITTNNNRLKDLCSKFKRRLTLTKEHRTNSEDTNESLSERRSINFGNYKSFAPSNDFKWPDFEKVYDSIPSCLINTLPGIDDFSMEDNDDYSSNILDYQTDLCSIEQMNLFIECKRGKFFRRNAICQKLDKTQHNGQLETFTEQLMIEKLMRTWT